MKILICGKGGCGKSTLSVMLARAFDAMGRQVLLVDADESNFGIAHLIGVAPPMDLMESLGGKKGFKEKINAPISENPQGIFPMGQSMADLPEDCVSETGNIRVVSIGKIHDYKEGCACPMGMLSTRFLESLRVDSGQIVIVDTEAGVEHFGRGVIGCADVMLAVVDPTAESLKLAAKMAGMAAHADRPLYFVINKSEPEIEAMITSRLDPEKVAATIPKDHDLFVASLQGIAITRAGQHAEGLARWLEEASWKAR